MKRMHIALAELATRDNLALAVYKAARGKRNQPDVAAFLADLDARLATLSARILAGQVPSGVQRQFVIHDPKRRTVNAPSFDDRVLHHAVFNRAEPVLKRALTSAAFACRPGLGVHTAVAAVQTGLQRWPWVVQVDVEHYFETIDHGVLMTKLARRFKGADFLALLQRLVCGAGAGQCQGLRFCGVRVRPGVLLPGARKLARYRSAVARLSRAEAAGAEQAVLQRAHDAQLPALLPAQSLHFRQRLWWPAKSTPL